MLSEAIILDLESLLEFWYINERENTINMISFKLDTRIASIFRKCCTFCLLLRNLIFIFVTFETQTLTYSIADTRPTALGSHSERLILFCFF